MQLWLMVSTPSTDDEKELAGIIIYIHLPYGRVVVGGCNNSGCMARSELKRSCLPRLKFRGEGPKATVSRGLSGLWLAGERTKFHAVTGSSGGEKQFILREP